LAFTPGRFVAGSAGLADTWGVPRVLVGAVIVGFGTSAPEMLVSGLAAAQGDADVGAGNIVGSNVANLSLVLGIAALVGTMAVPRGLVRSELPLLGDRRGRDRRRGGVVRRLHRHLRRGHALTGGLTSCLSNT
jgi:cation:H+ antiporter